MLERQAFTEPMAESQKKLSEALDGGAGKEAVTSVCGGVLDGLKEVNEKWKAEVQEVMRRCEKRMTLYGACADTKKAVVMYQVEAIKVRGGYMCVFMCVCMYVCMYVCVCTR
jgi:hypothetical protein